MSTFTVTVPPKQTQTTVHLVIGTRAGRKRSLARNSDRILRRQGGQLARGIESLQLEGLLALPGGRLRGAFLRQKRLVYLREKLGSPLPPSCWCEGCHKCAGEMATQHTSWSCPSTCCINLRFSVLLPLLEKLLATAARNDVIGWMRNSPSTNSSYVTFCQVQTSKPEARSCFRRILSITPEMAYLASGVDMTTTTKPPFPQRKPSPRSPSTSPAVLSLLPLRIRSVSNSDLSVDQTPPLCAAKLGLTVAAQSRAKFERST